MPQVCNENHDEKYQHKTLCLAQPVKVCQSKQDLWTEIFFFIFSFVCLLCVCHLNAGILVNHEHFKVQLRLISLPPLQALRKIVRKRLLIVKMLSDEKLTWQ